ncbi:MAG: hypothetical protein QME79_06960 [Bacillota bacterium]|nr:hypothetical protein [Bacillota bacterium]
MLQRTNSIRRTTAVAALALLFVTLPALTPPPALAVSTEVLRVPTAEVLPFLRLALEAGLPFESTVQKATVGLPHGFQFAAAVPPGGTYAEGLTADLRYRLVEGNLVTPAVAVGATYNTKSQAVSPYAVVTKGILNVELTAGVRLDELVAGSEDPVFAGADLAVFGPLHALAEYEDGTTRFGAKLSLLNAEVKAYLEGAELNVLGRLILPF